MKSIKDRDKDKGEYAIDSIKSCACMWREIIYRKQLYMLQNLT